MKRLICTLLSVLLVASITACKRENPDSSSQSGTEDVGQTETTTGGPEESLSAPQADGQQLMAGFTRALYKASPSGIRISTDETTDNNSKQRIAISKELLDDLAYLLSKAEWTPEEMKSVQGDIRTIQLQMTGGGDVRSLQLMACGETAEPFPNKLVAWLQIGEETASLVGELSDFEEISQRLQEALVERKVTLEGNFLPFQSSYQSELDGGEYYNSSYLQWENKILCVHTSDNQTLFETLDVYTGEVKDTFSVDERSFGIEKEGSGYSVWYQDRVEYRSIDQPGAVQTEIKIPENIASQLAGNSDRLFSIRDGKIAYAAKDGIYWGELDGAQEKILDNSALIEILKDRLPTELPEGFEPAYTQPRIVNDGKQVIAMILVPGSQIGFYGFSVYDTQSGGIQSDPDFFTVMQEGAFYPDDQTIAVMGYHTYTFLDIPTFEKKQIQLSQEYYQMTVDGKKFVGSNYEVGDDGNPVNTLYTYTLEDGQEIDKMPLIAATGENFYIQAITDHVIICKKDDVDGKMMLAVTYQ